MAVICIQCYLANISGYVYKHRNGSDSAGVSVYLCVLHWIQMSNAFDLDRRECGVFTVKWLYFWVKLNNAGHLKCSQYSQYHLCEQALRVLALQNRCSMHRIYGLYPVCFSHPFFSLRFAVVLVHVAYL